MVMYTLYHSVRRETIEFENSTDLYEKLKEDIDARTKISFGPYVANFAKFSYQIWSNTNHFGWPRSNAVLCAEIEYTAADPNNPPVPWQSWAPTFRPGLLVTTTQPAPPWVPPDYSNKRALVDAVRVGGIKTESEDYQKEFEDLDIKAFEAEDRIYDYFLFDSWGCLGEKKF